MNVDAQYPIELGTQLLEKQMLDHMLSTQNKPTHRDGLKNFLKKWTKTVHYMDPVKLLSSNHISELKNNKVVVISKREHVLDMQILRQNLWADTLLRAKTSGSCIVVSDLHSQSNTGIFDSLNLSNKSEEEALDSIKKSACFFLNGSRKCLCDKEQILCDQLLDRVITNLKESDYLEVSENDEGKESIKYNMPSNFMMLFLREVMDSYKKHFDFDSSNLNWRKAVPPILSLIQEKNSKIEELRDRISECDEILRQQVLSEAVDSLNQVKINKNGSCQLHDAHKVARSTRENLFNVIGRSLRHGYLDMDSYEDTWEDSNSRSSGSSCDLSPERKRRRSSSSSSSNVSTERLKSPYRCHSLSSRDRYSRGRSPPRKRPHSNRCRSFSPDSSSSRDGSLERLSHGRKRFRSRSTSLRSSSCSSAKTNNSSRERSKSQSKEETSFTPAKRKNADSSNEDGGSLAWGSIRKSTSSNYDHTDNSNSLPKSNTRSRSQSFDRDVYTGFTRSRSNTLEKDIGTHVPPKYDRKRGRSTKKNVLDERERKQTTSLMEEGFLIGQLMGLTCKDLRDEEVIDKVCDAMQSMNVKQLTTIPENFDIETLSAVLGLEKMGESRPKTVKALKASLKPLCRFIYFRDPGDIKELELKHTHNIPAKKIKRKTRGRNDTAKHLVVISREKTRENIKISLKNMLFRKKNTEVLSHMGRKRSCRAEQNKKRTFGEKAFKAQQASYNRENVDHIHPKKDNFSRNLSYERKSISMLKDMYMLLARACQVKCRQWNTTVVEVTDTAHERIHFAKKVQGWLEKMYATEHMNVEANADLKMETNCSDSNDIESKVKTIRIPSFPSYTSLLLEFVGTCIEVRDLSADDLLQILTNKQIISIDYEGKVKYLFENNQDKKDLLLGNMMQDTKERAKSDEIAYEIIKNKYKDTESAMRPSDVEKDDEYELRAALWRSRECYRQPKNHGNQI